MADSRRHVFEFDPYQTPIGRFYDKLEPKTEKSMSSSLKISRNDLESVPRSFVDGDVERFRPRRSKSRIRSDSDSNGGIQAGSRNARESVMAISGIRDPEWSIKRFSGSREERSRSSSRESITRNCSAISRYRSFRRGGSEPSGSACDSD